MKKLFIFCLVVLALNGCRKADNFYDKLNSLPQVDIAENYAYKASYLVGDTLVMYGKLNPKNNLKITIGGINAQFLLVDSVETGQVGSKTTLDRVYILITVEMVGKSREVKISSSGNEVLAPSIDISIVGGEGSFSQSLKAVSLTPLPFGNKQFLYCVNGKGDVYYYNSSGIRHIKKDGTNELVYQPTGSFIAGGIDPNGRYLYYSAYAGRGSTLNRLDLNDHTLTVLSDSPGIGAPYEGDISDVHIQVTGIYPDSKGDVYLAVGGDNGNVDKAGNVIPYAIAIYNTKDGKVAYSIKNIVPSNYPDMPGNSLNTVNFMRGVRIGAEDGILYVLQTTYKGSYQPVIDVIDLPSHSRLQQFTLTPNSDLSSAAAYTELIAPFTSLKITTSDISDAAKAFGFMPMPGKRLQTLLFQYVDGTLLNLGAKNVASQLALPRWTVFDFTGQRTYTWAPGRFELNSYQFNNLDVLLNYDEGGNLYMTGNSKSLIVKTAINN